MSNEKAPIPEDLKAAYQRAKSALEYGQCGDPTRFEKEIWAIERIAALTAECDALKAQVARLSAPVSDEEWHTLWCDGLCLGMIGTEGTTKEGVNKLILARATPLQDVENSPQS